MLELIIAPEPAIFGHQVRSGPSTLPIYLSNQHRFCITRPHTGFHGGSSSKSESWRHHTRPQDGWWRTSVDITSCWIWTTLLPFVHCTPRALTVSGEAGAGVVHGAFRVVAFKGYCCGSWVECVIGKWGGSCSPKCGTEGMNP